MDNKYLAEITERANKATPGPWKLLVRGNTVKSLAIEGVCGGMKFIDRSDAEFIANARTDVPALIAEVERLTQQNNSLSAALDDTIATQHYLQGENDTLAAQLAEAKADLAAAVEDMKSVIPSPCAICVSWNTDEESEPCISCTAKNNNFVWRYRKDGGDE